MVRFDHVGLKHGEVTAMRLHKAVKVHGVVRYWGSLRLVISHPAHVSVAHLKNFDFYELHPTDSEYNYETRKFAYFLNGCEVESFKAYLGSVSSFDENFLYHVFEV